MTTSAETALPPIVFLDTETCGLAWEDPVWEIGAIRREPDGRESEHHTFVEHDTRLAMALPDGLRADHDARYESSTALQPSEVPAWLNTACNSPTTRPILVGANPTFDLIRLEYQFEADPFHYRPVCAETMAWTSLVTTGWVSASDMPWDSDRITELLGVRVRGDGERHTALGDARWVRDIFDAVVAGASAAARSTPLVSVRTGGAR